MLIQSEALKLLESTLNDLESPQGTILSAIQKLYRAADLVEDEDVKKWCAIQLADQKYTDPLGKLLNLYREIHGKKKGTKIYDELSTKITAQYEDLKKLGLNKKHFNSEELNSKYNESGGGMLE
ncbi:hypothetical protein [Enterobacter sp. EGD-HP1]|uniref:hypothetical protein n=1 Tax=Enterobacter sp. EGD-HP1 TaxID=1357268 RepID=UPI0004DB4A00|nr:hypothetical protein [Enterobacter sp. EGD-HP1]KFA82057.1 hypothetical protein N037_15755 [Enterobacter sp. EGD-HP1]